MIYVMPPSLKMAMDFHNVAASIEHEADRIMQDKLELKNTISVDRIGRLEFLMVKKNAAKHIDEEFAWSALWCVRSSGHILHTQDRIRKPKQQTSAVMIPGHIYLFDSRLPHWTTNGSSVLVCAGEEFGEKVGVESVHQAFDSSLDGLNDRWTDIRSARLGVDFRAPE